MALGDWSVFDKMKDRFQKEIENDDSIVTSKSFLKTTKDERIVMEDKKQIISAGEILNGWAGEIKAQNPDYENRNPYMRELPTGITGLDVYGVLDLFGVKHHQTGQAIKKLLCPGERGSKGEIQDLQEAIKLIKQAIVKLEREA